MDSFYVRIVKIIDKERRIYFELVKEYTGRNPNDIPINIYWAGEKERRENVEDEMLKSEINKILEDL